MCDALMGTFNVADGKEGVKFHCLAHCWVDFLF